MISIITSLYKSERHLPTFLKKIARVSAELSARNFQHEFLILPNDASPAETEMLTEAAAKIPAIRIINRKREFLYATWNAGIENAKFETVAFWNVDDIRFTDGFVNGYAAISAGADIAYFPFIYKRYANILGLKILAKRKILRPSQFDAAKFSSEFHIGPFFMTTKSAIQKIGGFDPSFTVAGDFEWQVRATKSGAKFQLCDSVAGIFTNDGKSLSGSQSARHADENKRVLEYGAK